jgi:imidazolonepropionase-like amidohydrolase
LGFTSAKAYADITADELQASIDEAHRLGMKLTGHLCSVGYEQAIEFGIDNLEHGPFQSPDGDLDPDRNPGTCTSTKGGTSRSVMRFEIGSSMEPNSAELQKLIRLMVEHKVALTSTLAVEEGGLRPSLESMTRQKALLHPVAWARVAELHASEAPRAGDFDRNLKKEMAFELAFSRAGGLLMAGCDPTGDGHAIAGIGDQRNLELLVEAGFTVPETVRIATLNGAIFEGIADHTGSITAGKAADLVLLDGDLAEDIATIEKPEIVFKGGIGYNSAAIYTSLAGQVGLR